MDNKYYKVEVTQHSPTTCTVTAYTSSDIEWDKEKEKPMKKKSEIILCMKILVFIGAIITQAMFIDNYPQLMWVILIPYAYINYRILSWILK